jgi:hypothetical protein
LHGFGLDGFGLDGFGLDGFGFGSLQLLQPWMASAASALVEFSLGWL